MRKLRPFLAALSLALVLAPLAVRDGAAADAPPAAPKSPEIVERVDVAIVQVDVSVTDPKSPSRASVRGLTAADFDVRIDGGALPPGERERLVVDEMCSEAEGSFRPVLVVVDYNYVDAAGRIRVAEAIARLADAPVPGLAYKFYGLTREVRALSDGFVRDGETIRRVAETVRSAEATGDRTVPPRYLATFRSLLMQGGAGGCSG